MKKKISKPQETQSTYFVQFRDPSGVLNQDVLTMSSKTNVEEMRKIVNQLNQSEDSNYVFMFKTYQIQNDLTELSREFSSKEISSEKTLIIDYFEDSLADVKPVTRISTSLDGHTKPVLMVRFSPDSKYIASVAGDNTIRLWDALTETAYIKIEYHQSWVMVVQWSPNSEGFLTADQNGLICFWRLQEVIQRRLEIKGNPKLKYQPEAVFNGHKGFITSLSFRPYHLDPNCESFVSSSKDGTLRFWDIKTRKQYKVCANHTKSITGVVWTGQDRIVSISQDLTLMVWDRNGTHIKTLKGHAHWINCLAISTEFALRVSYHLNQNNQSDSKLLESQKNYSKFYNVLGKELLVTGSDDKSMIVWDLEKSDGKEKLERLTGHSGPINHIMFAPNSVFFVSASFDKTLRIWAVSTMNCLGVLKGHVSEVYLLNFSRDSKWIVSGSKDSTLQVWNVKQKKRAYQLPGHADQIFALDWSLDGEKMVSGGKDCMVRIWKN